MSPRKKLLGKSWIGFPIFMLLLQVSAFGQSKEIGLSILASNYTGDLSRNYEFRELRPGMDFYYRNNFSKYVSLKLGLGGTMLYGDDQNAIDSFAVVRDASFDIFMLEATAVIEYYFLNFRENLALLRWSPYIYVGAGAMYFFGNDENEVDYSNFQPVLPVGLGLKFQLDPQWALGMHFGARKTFTDYIDNVGAGDQTIKITQPGVAPYGNPNLKDWYYQLGFTISYTFYGIPCPFDYN